MNIRDRKGFFEEKMASLKVFIAHKTFHCPLVFFPTEWKLKVYLKQNTASRLTRSPSFAFMSLLDMLINIPGPPDEQKETYYTHVDHHIVSSRAEIV